MFVCLATVDCTAVIFSTDVHVWPYCTFPLSVRLSVSRVATMLATPCKWGPWDISFTYYQGGSDFHPVWICKLSQQRIFTVLSHSGIINPKCMSV